MTLSAVAEEYNLRPGNIYWMSCGYIGGNIEIQYAYALTDSWLDATSTWAPSLLSDINLYTPSESGLFFRSKLLEYGTCLDRPVRVIGTDTLYFPALQSAYNVMEDGAIIQGQTVEVPGDQSIQTRVIGI